MSDEERFRLAALFVLSDRTRPTDRELEVARLAVIDGLTHSEVGAVLGIAPGTAKTHLGRFAAKAGLPLRTCRRQLLHAYYEIPAKPRDDERPTAGDAPGKEQR